MPTIRPSTDSDIPAITAIYQHHVLHGTGTFEIDPPSEADMSGRRADVLARGLPWLVAVKDGEVLGFTDVGVMRSVGWKFGAWRDIVLMEKTLGAGDTTSPE